VSTVVLAYQLPHLDNSTTEWQKPMMHNPTLMADTVGQHFDGQYWQPTVMACTSLDLILSAVNRPSKMTADMAWTLSGQYRLMCCRLRTTATQHLNNYVVYDKPKVTISDFAIMLLIWLQCNKLTFNYSQQTHNRYASFSKDAYNSKTSAIYSNTQTLWQCFDIDNGNFLC